MCHGVHSLTLELQRAALILYSIYLQETDISMGQINRFYSAEMSLHCPPLYSSTSTGFIKNETHDITIIDAKKKADDDIAFSPDRNLATGGKNCITSVTGSRVYLP